MVLPSLLLALLMAFLSYPNIELSRNWPFFFMIEWNWPVWPSVASSLILLTISATVINALANSFELNGRRNSFAGAYFILLASMSDISAERSRHLIFILLF